MNAYDSRYPERPTVATVNITVSRNLNGPIFVQTPYTFRTNETSDMYTVIGTVTANDADVLVSHFYSSLLNVGFPTFVLNNRAVNVVLFRLYSV